MCVGSMYVCVKIQEKEVVFYKGITTYFCNVELLLKYRLI